MVRTIRKKRRKIRAVNGSHYLPVWSEWHDLLNMDDQQTEVTTAVVETKHGLAFMAWTDEQLTLDDLGEEL